MARSRRLRSERTASRREDAPPSSDNSHSVEEEISSSDSS